MDLPEHPLRSALLELLRRRPAVTSTEAARELGGSSGLHSFHLRQLARAGLIEAVPGVSGRSRPWRLVTGESRSDGDGQGDGPQAVGRAVVQTRDDGGLPSSDGRAALSALNRQLEDDSFHHWLAERNRAPARWRQDEAFSQVLMMTPEELSAMASLVRAAMLPYLAREGRDNPPGAKPVAFVVRLFPLLNDADPPVGR